MPETEAIWRPLRSVLDREAVAVALPGFGAPWPEGFSGTKDAYAEWLASTLARLDAPVDVVGHDLGALLTLRVVTAFDLPVRSWVVDVANVFHPGFTWPDRVLQLQRPGVGEEMLERTDTAAQLAGSGAPHDLAIEIGRADGELMRRSILSFYRSAVPNVGADWWDGPASGHGAVLLLPDPPEQEAMSVAVAERLGAETIRLGGLDHCWMAQSPSLVASRLESFWSF